MGTFLYSEKEKSWVIISDSVILLPNDTLPERPIIYEIEDNEVFVDDATRAEYNKLIGNTVIFSGKYETLGNEILTDYAYLVGYGYTLRGFLPADVNISLANTRSAMENVIEAEVFAEENKPIKLEKKVKDKNDDGRSSTLLEAYENDVTLSLLPYLGISNVTIIISGNGVMDSYTLSLPANQMQSFDISTYGEGDYQLQIVLPDGEVLSGDFVIE